MHRYTPSITVIEPRGLSVRELAYHRRATGGLLETRVTHQVHDVAGRLCEQRDPRLFVSSLTDPDVPVNLRTIYGLSGQSLCSDSVDAGWQMSLPGPDGLAVEMWDQRKWHRRIEYDLLLRPVAIAEHISGEPERYAERIIWGHYMPDDALHNRCGQPVRHDDPAGSLLIPEYGLSGAVLAEVRHFLDSAEPPNWPVDEVARGLLLEPSEGARSDWHFAATGEVLTQMDANGHIRHLRLDRIGQLREIGLQRAQCNTVETLVGGIEYSAAGQVFEELAGNGIRTVSSYDQANGNLLKLANQAPNGQFLQKLSYCYDPAGNIINITDASLPIQHSANQRIEPARHFTYDTLYQLIKATGWESAKPSLGPALPEWQPFGATDSSRWCNYTETYIYDAAGNLLQRIHQGAVDDTLTMQVAAHSNRSIKERPGAELDELFDARGNLLELQPGQSLQWNGRNELTEVVQVARSGAPGDREFYHYDHEGMRVRKCRTAAAKSIIHSAEVRYLPGLELHSNSATGENLQVVSVQAGRCSVRLLHWDSPPPSGVDNDQLRYCFDDHLGSSAIEVDADAKPISQEIYYPFGGTACLVGRNKVETSYKTIRYSGKERDATGLYYYGARYYVSWFQRWLNPDPANDVDGLCFYRFIRNNPANLIDLMGFAPTTLDRQGVDYDLDLECRLDFPLSVTYRGLAAIKEHLPLDYQRFNHALKDAKAVLRSTVRELSEGRLNVGPGMVQTFFGSIKEENLDYLVEGYKRMLLEVESIEATPSRIVFFNNHERFDGFVIKNDLNKKIYINQDRLTSANTMEMIIHEVAHLRDTFDAWDGYYLSCSGSTTKGTRIKSREDSARKFSEGTDVEEADVDQRPDDFKKLVGLDSASSLSYALSIFKSNAVVRSRVALGTADVLMGFSISAAKDNKPTYRVFQFPD